MKSKAPIDRAVVLPGHQPINEEPGYYIKKNVNSDKIAKKIPKDTSKATSPGVIAIKNREDSNDHYEMPIATMVNEPEIRNESNDSEDTIWADVQVIRCD